MDLLPLSTSRRCNVRPRQTAWIKTRGPGCHCLSRAIFRVVRVLTGSGWPSFVKSTGVRRLTKDKLTITVFPNTPYRYTFPLIPALVGILFLESFGVLSFGSFGLLASHPTPKWLWFLVYVAELIACHMFLIMWYPRLCRWLRQRVLYASNGVAYLRLLQVFVALPTGGLTWLLWYFM